MIDLSVRIWRAPDGTHWRIGGRDWLASDAVLPLLQQEQDLDTRQWHDAENPAFRERPVAEIEATYTPVTPEPLRDPRITRLAGLVTALLADYETVTGVPAAQADGIRGALAEVSAIPEEARRQRHGEARLARRAGFYRGRGR